MKKRLLAGIATGLLLTGHIGSAVANIIDDTFGAGAGSFELGSGFVANQYNFMPLGQGSTLIGGWTVGVLIFFYAPILAGLPAAP